MIIAN